MKYMQWLGLSTKPHINKPNKSNKPLTDFWILPPKPDSNRKGIAAVLIAKNEGKFLWDWLTFHVLAGIEHFIVYHHESNDGSQAIVSQFAQSQSLAKVTQVPWGLAMHSHHDPSKKRPYHIQQLAYTHAVCTFGKLFERMIFIDADEYLVPLPGYSIAQSIPDHPMVRLPWVMFGHNGYESYPGLAEPFAYTQKAVSTDPALVNYKCIVDPCDVVCVGTHRFVTHSQGRKKATPLVKDGKPALQLNHYYLRSVQEMVAKYERGNVGRFTPTQLKNAILKKRDLIEEGTAIDVAAAEYLASHGIHNSEELRAHFSSKHS